MRTRRTYRAALYTALILTTIFVIPAGIVIYVAGSALAAPSPADVGKPRIDLSFESVKIPSESGSTLAGWFFAHDDPRGGVVLLHGVHANRLDVIDRVPFLNKAGYAVLAIDFQAHGESPGEHITFGYLESRDARAAVAYLRSRLPDRPVAAIGISMGGAAAVLGDKPLGADAVVLECVYPTVEEATRNRLTHRLGTAGGLLTPILLLQIKPRLGFPSSELHPIDHIATIGAPVLIIAGMADPLTPFAESNRLFDAAAEPKEFWAVPGAGHDNYHYCVPEEYERRVLSFLDRYLIPAKTDRNALTALSPVAN